MPVKVQKKDGRLEDFNRTKIFTGIIKSGASPEEAENITKQIEVWAPTAAQNGVLKSEEIKIKLLEILRTVNSGAAAAFEAYKKVI